MVALVGCRSAETGPSRVVTLESIGIMLREGRIERAVEEIEKLQPLDSGDHELAQWDSALAELLWRDDDAIRHQLDAVRRARIARVDGDTDAMLRGRLGDLLFQAGRYGEATVPLEAGAVGSQSDRRSAFAAVSRLLPFTLRQTGPLLTEQQLVGAGIPEFVCRAGGLQRSFAIDTGTSMTTLSSSMASELGVRGRRPAGSVVDSMGGVVPVEVGVLTRFAVGDVDVGDVPVLIVEDAAMTLRDLYGGDEQVPRGVLGLNLLGTFRMTVDPERNSVTFELPRRLPAMGSVQCVRANGRCLVPVTIDSGRLWFVLDTGASHSSLTPSGMACLSAGRRAVPAFRRVRSVGGGQIAVREVCDLVLRVSEARFRGVVLPIIPRDPGGSFPVHGVLGMDLLGRCRLTLDSGRARVQPHDPDTGW
ncbi:MAG: aspartyl protease family protein [Planctomycetes bacterium]|nr:aspartyl protease family protein [Planctomycetota bacterium]